MLCPVVKQKYVIAPPARCVLPVLCALLLSACGVAVDTVERAPLEIGSSAEATKSAKIPDEADPVSRVSGTTPDGIPALIAPWQQPAVTDNSAASYEDRPAKDHPGRHYPGKDHPGENLPGIGDSLYTVIADQLPVKEIVASIARDARSELDFVGDISGVISLSIIDQPLDFILTQISTQTDVRYEIQDKKILLIEDKPFIRSYEVDYLNMQRTSQSRVDLATQIGSITTNPQGGNESQAGSNGSRLSVENVSVNALWESIVRSISGVLGEQVSDTGAGSDNVFVSQEAGIITVRARQLQHATIEKLLKEINQSAQRQVLIEATVVEITLNDRFESGVDWQALGSNDNESFQFSQILAGLPDAASATSPVTALFSYSNAASIFGDLSATLKLLQQFGEVQVISRPKIIALNNQPAVLKVVDNRVYFTFEVDRLERENGDERTVVDSTVHSVPIGLVMNVTPFISNSQDVILNVRPTISRILNFAEDPSPALAGQNEVRNLIPEIQVREMESLLKVRSGNVAIIGGLMQNSVEERSTGVPGLKQLPVLGRLFSHDIRSIEKTELLIFLKPTVIESSFTDLRQ